MSTNRLAISVGGKFHADHLYRAAQAAGWSAKLFTSFPGSQFAEISPADVSSFLPAEAIYRVGRKLQAEDAADLLKMSWYGKWASRRIAEEGPFQLFWGWSSFSLEALRKRLAMQQWVMRDSSHIDFQYDLLAAEYEKIAVPFPRREKVRQREIEEYELADRIVVLSDFAKKTFLDRGFAEDKISVLRLGVDISRFQPPEEFSVKLPLRVLYFGSVSFRKGAHYLLESMQHFGETDVEFHFIGPVEESFVSYARRFPRAKFLGRLPQAEAAVQLRSYHVLVFPTLEDGFGQTLIQAMAAGLFPISTSHCGASEMIEPGVSGWVVPPFEPKALSEKIQDLLDSLSVLPARRLAAVHRAQQVSWANYEKEVARLLGG